MVFEATHAAWTKARADANTMHAARGYRLEAHGALELARHRVLLLIARSSTDRAATWTVAGKAEAAVSGQTATVAVGSAVSDGARPSTE
jgi:hypothetical protein